MASVLVPDGAAHRALDGRHPEVEEFLGVLLPFALGVPPGDGPPGDGP